MVSRCTGSGDTPGSAAGTGRSIPRVLPAGPECRVGAPPPGTPHHQPQFRGGRLSIPPRDRLARGVGWGWGNGTWWGRRLH